MSTLKDLKRELMKNPEFRKEYERFDLRLVIEKRLIYIRIFWFNVKMWFKALWKLLEL